MPEAPTPSGSIVIPAFDESERIVGAVEAAFAWSDERGGRAEVIVVDDGSRDDTAALAEAAGARVLRLARNRGKGAAVRTGVLAARGDPILFADADLSTPIDAWGDLLARHADGADVAIGIRTRETVSERQPLHRIALGKAGLVLAAALLQHGVSDTQCGFKSFRAAAAKQIFERARIDRFGFDMELLVIARRLGMRVDAVPVPWAHDPRSRVQPLRDGLRTLGEVARIAWHRMRGHYDPER